MLRLSEAQRRVLAELTCGTGNHLRWEENKGHLRVYSQGGLRLSGDPVRRPTWGSLLDRGLLERDRLANGTVTYYPTVEAWALAHKGGLR